jgi:hypothetical protein
MEGRKDTEEGKIEIAEPNIAKGNTKQKRE